MQYFDHERGESYIPFVIETSIGVDRMFLQIISAAYKDEELKKEDGSSDTRVVLRLPSFLAPVKLAVMPLVKKDGLPDIAEKIVHDLKFDFNCQYDDKDSIGRRYRRQDAIGTPYCITIDHQTLEDQSVTIRYRDSMAQERVNIEQLKEIIKEKVSIQSLLKKL
jgi:glycyl-tRNA synthetase